MVGVNRVPIVALASGTGTLLQALLDAAYETDYPADIVALVTDQPRCGAARRARGARVPVHIVEPQAFADRADWDAAITAEVARYSPEWVVSVGFMRILGPQFLAAFPQKVLNTHPSLLPSFPGARPVADAVEYGVKITGCTVHVIDAGIDSGPVVAQRPLAVESDDTAESLHDRIKTVERQLVVEVVDRVASHGLRFEGRKAIIP
jgi:phosphoribosylglycinamide formyltransferase 1